METMMRIDGSLLYVMKGTLEGEIYVCTFQAHFSLFRFVPL